MIHHPPWMPDAIRIEAAPLLLLYLWCDGGLAQQSVVD
jgi:hypothetical protein